MAEKSSIFSKLLPKNDSENARRAQENYFTKIVVHLLNTFPEILFAWLKDISLIDDISAYTSPVIKREIHYHPLSDQLKASRIDIQIESRSRELLIFIEAKIDAKGYLEPLRRYAKQLNEQSAPKKILLYVTKRTAPRFHQSEVCQGISTPNIIQLQQSSGTRILW
jgi:hypothetical protein